jgi:hypothetical protein
MQFSNKTNATLVNYVMSQEDGNAMVVAINLILSGEDYEVPEPLEEEPLEEESSSSNSDSSDSEESGPLRTAVEK